MSENKLAEVKTLNESNFRNTVATLRRVADGIEAGDYGRVDSVVFILAGESLKVFHLGEGEAADAHLLLACGQRKLEHALLINKDGYEL